MTVFALKRKSSEHKGVNMDPRKSKNTNDIEPKEEIVQNFKKEARGINLTKEYCSKQTSSTHSLRGSENSKPKEICSFDS